jgi:hypothetical protein
MTLPEYRGRGYFGELERICVAEIRSAGDVGHTFPNGRSEGSFRRSEWHELCRVPLRTCVPSRHLGVASNGIVEITEFDSRAESIWMSSGLRIGVHRDERYLDWRYRKPGELYRRFYLSSETVSWF